MNKNNLLNLLGNNTKQNHVDRLIRCNFEIRDIETVERPMGMMQHH